MCHGRRVVVHDDVAAGDPAGHSSVGKQTLEELPTVPHDEIPVTENPGQERVLGVRDQGGLVPTGPEKSSRLPEFLLFRMTREHRHQEWEWDGPSAVGERPAERGGKAQQIVQTVVLVERPEEGLEWNKISKQIECGRHQQEHGVVEKELAEQPRVRVSARIHLTVRQAVGVQDDESLEEVRTVLENGGPEEEAPVVAHEGQVCARVRL